MVDAGAIHDRRADLCPADQSLQVAVVPIAKGRGLKPHRALARAEAALNGPVQETWLVVSGSIRVELFDLDGRALLSAVLTPGWVLVTLQGGHAVEALEDRTTIVECKPGPYVGRDYEFLPAETSDVQK